MQYATSLPLDRNHVLNFFASLVEIQNKAVSTVRGYKSAIVWYYKEQEQLLSVELDTAMENFLSDYKRKVSDLKLKGEMAVFEGKHHLTFRGYVLLAEKLLCLPQSNQMLFAWAFLVSQWNLISGSSSVAAIMMEHITWEEDSLVIRTPKHKGNQESSHCYPKHVFANPLQPSICPILALP